MWTSLPIQPMPSVNSLARYLCLGLVLGLWMVGPLSTLGWGEGREPVPAAQSSAVTERLMLSGTGIEDAVPWEFFCTDGRRSGEWTEIPVPSHWEQHGFGTYNYGHDDDPSREQGLYKRRFRVPEDWHGQRIELVFEGVMTDAEVTINGESAGPIHRGAFYPFRFEISSLVKRGAENLLEVTVSKHSSDKRVNRAERDADYWIFGGIFRPVYLESKATESIERWAVDGRHGGALEVDVFLHPLGTPGELVWWVSDPAGHPLAAEQTLDVAAGATRVELAASFPGAQPWSAEEPRLHRLHLRLQRGDEVLHRASGRFGFRTFEVRRDAGLFVNGQRVMLKGINRHVFWPSSGRATWPRRDRLDVETLKRLNLNAVRTAHYPPDKAFLDACDELGLYVLDELGGWHDAYGTSLGRELVRDMVVRDVNHPSILFWNNGNEGGWNVDLDEEFSKWDPQGRPVLHPDELLGDLETRHYPHWEEFLELLDESTWRRRTWGLRGIEPPLVMPTEILHGLYDGGSGAGLNVFWQQLRDDSRGAGAFLWSFTDESIERTDRQGELDSDGNHAPDGVLGPYREWSGTASAVRDVFSPIRVQAPEPAHFDGSLEVENRFDHLDLSKCRFFWQLLDLPSVDEDGGGRLVAWGQVMGPAIVPGESGTLDLQIPPGTSADALRLTALDSAGRDLMTWLWPLRSLYVQRARGGAAAVEAGGEGRATVDARGSTLRLEGGGYSAEIDATHGGLVSLGRGAQRLPLAGPRLAAAGEGASTPTATVRHRQDGPVAVVEAMRRDGLRRLRWSMEHDGWLRLSYLYEHSDETPYHGIDFPLARDLVVGLSWLGQGPARVWANRRQGAALGLWRKGQDASTAPQWGHEPKLEGYYGGVRWARLQLQQGELQIAFEEPGLDLAVLTPRFPEDSEEARADVPTTGLAVLGAIPPIGTKFHPAEILGPPPSQPGGPGLARGVIWLRWRPRT